MARAIRIPFTADPREFIRGLGLMEDDVKQFERRLKDSEQAGDQLEDNLEQNFRNIARDADAAGDRAGRSFDQQMTANVRRGSFRGAAGALLAETADEFIESWGEAIREGNPAGVITEVFSNAALIGAAAGGPVGAGIGLAISLASGFIAQAREEQQRMREAIRSAVAGAADETVAEQGYTTGKRFLDGLNQALGEQATQRQNLTDYYGAEDFITALQRAQAEADEVGVSAQIVQDIHAGTVDETRSAVEQLQAQHDELQGLIDDVRQKAATEQISTVEAATQLRTLEDQQDRMSGLIRQGQERVGVAEDAVAAVEREYRELGQVVAQIQTAISEQRTLNGVMSTATGSAQSIASNLRAASDSARSTRDYVASLGDKTVNINVVARLINQRELEAQIGASLASGYQRSGRSPQP